MFRRVMKGVCAAIAVLLASVPARSYSVFSHEAIVDALWDVRMKPILLARFPGASPDQLRAAHAYALGGSIIQDMGYYPYGNKFFSDLTHYVRSGDFVTNLVAESEDLNEYAFALGALSHYASDDNGHRLATNRAVPMLYPKLRNKFGDRVTYEDNPAAHLKTEFGFDVLEIAKGRFAPASYHDFIGFSVSKPLLERAFRDTYSLELSDIFKNLDLALGSYRRAISQTIPLATRVAWAQRQDEIKKSSPGITRRRFLYHVRRSSFEKEWGKQYKRPNTWERFLALLLKIVPKVGPLQALAFHMPTPEIEKLFMNSFNISLQKYTVKLQEAQSKHLDLPDMNFDVGEPTKPGVYKMADEAYCKLLDKLAEKNFAGLGGAIRSNILAYYANLDLPFSTKLNQKRWNRLRFELQTLKASRVFSAKPATAAGTL
jgi:hypothetical protein